MWSRHSRRTLPRNRSQTASGNVPTVTLTRPSYPNSDRLLEHRTEPFEEDLATLVEIETWGDESFEFAHFSDSEIADAILKVFHGNDAPSLVEPNSDL